MINILPRHDNDHILVPDSAIIIQTIWNDDVVINLFVRNEKKGFAGTLRQSKSASTAKDLELNFDQFMAETRKALCTENGLSNFTYILDIGSTSTKFKWVKSAGFRIIYGEVVLEDRPDVIENILMDSIAINAAKDQKIEAMHSNTRRMDEDFNAMKIALEKCVDEKNKLESEMLSKFAALLNTKKAKIAELEKALKNRPTGGFDDCESDGSGDDSDLDYCSQSFVREKSPVPSTSNQSANNDSTVVVPKRSRNKQTTNETTANVAEATVATVEETIHNVGETHPSTTEPMDIYERETEVLLDDM